MPKVLKTGRAHSRVIHPNSRKAGHLTQKQHHYSRIERRKEEANIKLQVKVQKFQWFQEKVKECTKVEKSDILDLVSQYFHRFDSELEQIDIIQNIKGRRGTQHSSRADSIRLTLDAEKKEFESVGIELPDLLNRDVLEFFRIWDGDTRYLPKLKLKRFTRVELEKSK